MKHRTLIGALLLLAMPVLGAGQSLSELAQKEKERRKKNKETGEEVQVITDRELVSNQGRIANPASSTPPAEGTGTTASSARSTPANRGTSAPVRDDTEVGDEAPPVTDIPADVPLEQKLRLLDRMKASYQQQVGTIDAEIAKNNQRLTEIENELVSTGGTGLPTAPQADLAIRNPGNIPGLRAEQQELRDKNQALEAQKLSAKEDIITRARRAGIPNSYLNF
jgi:hypothetical protein